jgi:hypothetical protein
MAEPIDEVKAALVRFATELSDALEVARPSVSAHSIDTALRQIKEAADKLIDTLDGDPDGAA